MYTTQTGMYMHTHKHTEDRRTWCLAKGLIAHVRPYLRSSHFPATFLLVRISQVTTALEQGILGISLSSQTADSNPYRPFHLQQIG